MNLNEKFEEMGITPQMIIVNAVMIFAGFVAILNSTLLTPALPSMMRDLNVDAATVQWLTTGYMLVSGILIPITAFLLDRFTTRALFFAAMGLFTLGTVIAGFSNSFAILLVARMLQASGSGIMMPMGQTVMLLTIPKRYRGVGMGMIGIVMCVAPAIGPTASGIIIDLFGWHMLFRIIAPLALLCILVAFFYLENFGETRKVSLDVPSVILSTLTFGGLLYGFSAMGSSGLSPMVIGTLIVGTVSAIFFTRRQLSMDKPFLDLGILKNRSYMISTVLTMIVQASIMFGAVLSPIYVQTLRGFNATASGLMMLPSSIVMMIMSPISGRWFDKYGARVMAIPGLAISALASIPFVVMGTNTSLVVLAIAYAVRSFGMSLVNMPLNTWGLNALDNAHIAHGTAIGNTFRQVASSFGTAIMITIMSVFIAVNPDPTAILTQIHGINAAYGAGTILLVLSLLLTILFVK